MGLRIAGRIVNAFRLWQGGGCTNIGILETRNRRYIRYGMKGGARTKTKRHLTMSEVEDMCRLRGNPIEQPQRKGNIIPFPKNPCA